jgi:hypothetical protein
MEIFCQTIHKFIIAGCVLFLFPVDTLATTYQVTQISLPNAKEDLALLALTVAK